MPKLIIKQETGAVTRKTEYAKWLSFGGLLLLLITVATAAVLFTKSPAKSPKFAPLSLSSLPDSAAKASYKSLYAILGELDAEYEDVAEYGVDDYQKNLKLLGKSESILAHLNKMDAVTRDLGLDADEQEELLDRHQFYKDYWQAKLHFRELRVSRFENKGKVEGDVAESIVLGEQGEQGELASDELPKSDDVLAGNQKKKFQFAKPPEGMELPAGFCDLTNSDSCKPELASEAETVLEALALPGEAELVSASDEVLVDKQKKKFQFAKPPEGMELPAGFCDLTNPDSCKPGLPSETETVLEELAFPNEAESVPVSDDLLVDKPKKKFQFAKPPEGMELPAGFCDLANPVSCKSESISETEAVPEQFLLPDEVQLIPALGEVVTDKPKKKFQFAKPPEGMELPAGFCDLSDPASCKPEAGNTSEALNGKDVEKKTVNKVVEPKSAEKTSDKGLNNKPTKQIVKKKTS